MAHGHRHADLLDYTLAQVRGYTSAHRAHEALALAARTDAQRVAVNADADAYAEYRQALLGPALPAQREPAWRSAWKRFAQAGALPDLDAAREAGALPEDGAE